MKVKILTLMGLLALSLNADASISRKDKRCQIDDKLTASQAKARNDWARQCGHISRATYNDYMYNQDGTMKSTPNYNSYHKQYDFYSWFKAPTNAGASCNLGQYTEALTCTVLADTSLPREQLQRCEDFRLQSFIENRITAYDYEYLKATEQVPLFSSRTHKMIGYYSCSEYN
ncbi:hypothetical protein A7985_13290 [Pseudoalteromonas luteoviolacea]|uniref:DUF1311 domain-containing protein n=1 Tax=Pseudoalteromonas luteoviolacea TaxID=43657 RepID=A0A1C0TPB2_9GAMM|nr:hypothetical protein [Pseudoalteromonas luteoviolacea]MBQ4811728.1 hypothetical protein [Pseudoalteromonas luteoviolacea]OCQ20772.1 hypothetical protein A7985_13290 [Pseudoalteromonas luteoviolacea]